MSSWCSASISTRQRSAISAFEVRRTYSWRAKLYDSPGMEQSEGHAVIRL